MTNRKAIRRARRIRRTVLTVCLMALVAVISIGGTIAWLTAKTSTITNTFTSAGIGISLTETKKSDGTAKETATQWTAEMVPGETYAKNPVVSVDATVTDVDVYLFVKFEEGSAQTYLNYTSLLDETTQTAGNEDKTWHKLTGVDGVNDVWYRVVKTTDAVKSWNLLQGKTGFTDGYVEVDSTAVTKENMSTAAAVSLKYTAYAIQTEGMDSVVDAWNNVPKS